MNVTIHDTRYPLNVETMLDLKPKSCSPNLMRKTVRVTNSQAAELRRFKGPILKQNIPINRSNYA